MKEIKAFPNRKWVIKVGIGFLIVMGLLTFFSNTIMNYSLPQVTVVYSTGGSMTTAVKGTGTVEAITQSKVIAKGVRKIDQVLFGVYEDVKEGDIIASLVPATDAENEELKTAEAALKALKNAQITDDLQTPVYDYSMDERAISDAQETLDKANATLTSAQGKDAAVAAAQAEITAAQSKIVTINNELMTLDTKRESYAGAEGTAAQNLEAAKGKLILAQGDLTTAQEKLAAVVAAGTDSTFETAAVEQALADVNQVQSEVDLAQTLYNQAAAAPADIEQQIKDKNTALKNAQAAETAAGDKLLAAQTLPSVTEASELVKLAQRSVDDLEKALADKKKADGVAQKISGMSDEDKAKALEDAQKKVDDLTALSDQTTIVAPKAGRISSINISSGSETVKGDVLVAIDVIEDGFKVPLTFTTEQVSQMQIGMGARLDNYGGSDKDATLVSIKPDSTDPRNKKVAIFLLNDPDNMFWFSSGTSVTLSLNNRSKDYQCIVPLSAVHEESGETFLYTIKEKTSPLGMRYIAIKVPVTILAKDDTNAAIDPSALGEYGSRVITESNDKSFKSGDQVRLAEGL